MNKKIFTLKTIIVVLLIGLQIYDLGKNGYNIDKVILIAWVSIAWIYIRKVYLYENE